MHCWRIGPFQHWSALLASWLDGLSHVRHCHSHIHLSFSKVSTSSPSPNYCCCYCCYCCCCCCCCMLPSVSGLSHFNKAGTFSSYFNHYITHCLPPSLHTLIPTLPHPLHSLVLSAVIWQERVSTCSDAASFPAPRTGLTPCWMWSTDGINTPCQHTIMTPSNVPYQCLINTLSTSYQRTLPTHTTVSTHAHSQTLTHPLSHNFQPTNA